jgi:hypothetical protein
MHGRRRPARPGTHVGRRIGADAARPDDADVAQVVAGIDARDAQDEARALCHLEHVAARPGVRVDLAPCAGVREGAVAVVQDDVAAGRLRSAVALEQQRRDHAVLDAGVVGRGQALHPAVLVEVELVLLLRVGVGGALCEIAALRRLRRLAAGVPAAGALHLVR